MNGRQPFVLRKGEGQSVWSLGGRFTMKVSEADAGGRFALVEALAFRATEPPLHIHHKEDEAWYVLDGHMTFYVGDAVLEADAGSFVFAPSGIAHTFTVDVEPTRVLVLASPAGFERFAVELGAPRLPISRPPTSVSPVPTSWARSRSATGSKSWAHHTARTADDRDELKSRRRG
jgi:mannose-6-phosphate isomerase-like protein (cupin superfamily)